MPKNFFKTFLVVISIFLFSAGITNPVLAGGCCIDDVVNPAVKCVVSNIDNETDCSNRGFTWESPSTVYDCVNSPECSPKTVARDSKSATTSTGTDSEIGTETSSGGWNVDSLAIFNLPGAPILGIVANIVEWILAIFSAIAIIAFAVAGIKYLTAAGNESMLESSKKAMYYSIIGVIVGLSGFVVLQAVIYMLNGNSVF